MEIYRHDRGCAMCGEKGSVNYFVKKGQSMYTLVGGPIASLNLIVRRCKNCGYRWEELTLEKGEN